MKKFNPYNEKTFKIRIVSAPAGSWYEKLVGSDIETCGYNQHDRANRWRVNYNGEEREIEHNDARYILRGNVAQWSTILVKPRGSRKHEEVAVLTGQSPITGALKVTFIDGGETVIEPSDIAQVLDEGKCYNDSAAYMIAKFYHKWSKKSYIVCPHCKASFEFYTFVDPVSLKCYACQREEKGESGSRLDEELFNNEWIQLTDEDIRKHNGEVLYRYFKTVFTPIPTDYPGYIGKDAPERLMQVGANVRYHIDLIGEDRVNELREMFKEAYKNLLIILKKRQAVKA